MNVLVHVIVDADTGETLAEETDYRIFLCKLGVYTESGVSVYTLKDRQYLFRGANS